MNKKIIIIGIIIIIIIIIIMLLCAIVLISKAHQNNKNDSSNNNYQENNNTSNNQDRIEGDNNMNNSEFVPEIKINIEGKNYILKLEDNPTTRELIDLLPLDLNMEELNGNEKYYYLDNTLPTNSKNPGSIEQGDVMLYGNNCLVIFYKSFNTSYSYTKIGHIDNLPDLGNKSIKISFNK